MSQPLPCSHLEVASTSSETRGRYEYRPRDPADSVVVQILEKHRESGARGTYVIRAIVGKGSAEGVLP